MPRPVFPEEYDEQGRVLCRCGQPADTWHKPGLHMCADCQAYEADLAYDAWKDDQMMRGDRS